MIKGPILQVAVDVPLSQLFDYLPPANAPCPEVGCRVRVRFGQRRQVGVVMAIADHSELEPGRVRRVDAVLDQRALLSAADRWLIRFTSDYYHHARTQRLALP